MCGRFVASRRVQDVAEILEAEDVDVPAELISPSWNVAPQAPVLALTCRVPRSGSGAGGGDGLGATARRRLSVYRWGLVPSWAKDPSAGSRMFNARAESLAAKPAFRTALAKRRCLVPADAFYEWEKAAAPSGGAIAARGAGGGRGPRQAWIFEAPDSELLTFAGLWEAWRPREADPATGEMAEWLMSCTIITTEANDTVAPVHNRMPVVIEPGDRAAWIGPGDASDAFSLLRPAAPGVLVSRPVSAEVNDARTDGPQLVRSIDVATERAEQPDETPARRAAEQGSLFDSL